MTISIEFLIGFFILILIIFLGVVMKMLSDLKGKISKSDELVMYMKSVADSVNSATRRVDDRLASSMTQFNNRLDSASLAIGQLQRHIGEFSAIGKQMQSIQEYLQSPKLRGNFGETLLKDLVIEHLPKGTYEFQYTFVHGQKVDLIIKTQQGLIPIDSKFPIDNVLKMLSSDSTGKFHTDFIRDIKKHIVDISDKYIKTSEGTVDYAMMYIPSESAYYAIIRESDIYTFANKNRVLLVSPMNFYAYLHMIALTFEGQNIEKRAANIIALFQSLKKDYENTTKSFSILGKHIVNSYNQLNIVQTFITTIGQKLASPTTQIETKDNQKSLKK